MLSFAIWWIQICTIRATRREAKLVDSFNDGTDDVIWSTRRRSDADVFKVFDVFRCDAIDGFGEANVIAAVFLRDFGEPLRIGAVAGADDEDEFAVFGDGLHRYLAVADGGAGVRVVVKPPNAT